MELDDSDEEIVLSDDLKVSNAVKDDTLPESGRSTTASAEIQTMDTSLTSSSCNFKIVVLQMITTGVELKDSDEDIVLADDLIREMAETDPLTSKDTAGIRKQNDLSLGLSGKNWLLINTTQRKQIR